MAKKTIAQLKAELKALQGFAKKQKKRADLEEERNELRIEIHKERMKTSRGGRAIIKLKKSKTLKKIGHRIRNFQPGEFAI